MPKIVADEQIFQAVIQVVSERGYAGATTKQMAETAGVSEVTLFRKYDSKLELIRQAVSHLIMQSNFPAQVQYTGSLEADLLRVVQTYQQTAVQHGQFIFMILVEMPRYPELASLLDTPLSIYADIGQLMRRYQAAGQLKAENPMHALVALLGPLIFASMLQKTLGEAVLPPLNLELHVSHFLEGRRSYGP